MTDKYDRLQAEVRELKANYSKQIQDAENVRKDELPPGFTPDTFPQAKQSFDEGWKVWKEKYGVREVVPEPDDPVAGVNSMNALVEDLIKEHL